MPYIVRTGRGRRRVLGDDTGDGTTAPAATDSDTLTQMLQLQQDQYAWLQQEDARNRMVKWVQVAVTASIPILGLAWKWLLKRRSLSSGID